MSEYTYYEPNDLVLTVPVNSEIVTRLMKELRKTFSSSNPEEFQDAVYLTGCVLTIGGLFDADFDTILIRYAHLFGDSEPSIYYHQEESGVGFYCIAQGDYHTCGVKPDNDWLKYGWVKNQPEARLENSV